jgi:PAS domain S-box-containing protein
MNARLRRHWVVIGLLALAAGPPTSADQTSVAAIGTVTDASGAVGGGATVAFEQEGTGATRSQDHQKTVLALYSTRRGAPAAAVMDRTFERILGGGLADRLDYYTEYIDLARFPEPGYQAALRDFLRSKYGQQQFELIIATTNATLEFVALNRDDLFPGVPVVFNSGPGAAVGPNATGVTSSLNFRDTLDIAASIQPEMWHVVVVSGASAWDNYYETVAREQFKEFEGRLVFTYLSGLPMPELLRHVASLPAHSMIYFTSLVEDGAGTRFVALDSLDKLTAVANAPIYSWHTVGMGHGIVGGSMQSAEVLGTRLAELALRVLGGETPDAIPVTDVDPNIIEFDWRQLRRWRIDESRLPPGSTVRFREPTVWERYRTYIVAAVSALLIQTALIAALLVQGARRRRIEATLVENQQRYALATSAGAVGVWDWKLGGDDMYIDPQLKLVLGYQDHEIRNHLDDWGQRLHPDDRQTVMDRAQACIDGRTDAYEVEHRMLHKDGSVRWFLARGTVIRAADGTPDRMVGTDTDITERRRAQMEIQANEAALRASSVELQSLAGRLIAAQESERTRIARDLHDDVSQQLAGLSIALSGLRRRVGAVQAGGDLLGDVSSLQQRTVALAENIRQLSYDLHPGVLQHAGLVAALTAHCADFQREQGLEVTLRVENEFASIAPSAALCLYRVAQEALRNTARHARARHAEVRLVRTGNSAELTIADDGKGFDLALVGRNGGGLGLLSINERVKLARGSASIVTGLNRGTRVQVRIPFERPADANDIGTHDQGTSV